VVNTEDYDRGTEGGEEEAVSPTMHAWDLGGFFGRKYGLHVSTRMNCHLNQMTGHSNTTVFDFSGCDAVVSLLLCE